MNCIVCGSESNKLIECKKHGIELSLCKKHANECDKCSCDDCGIVKVIQ